MNKAELTIEETLGCAKGTATEAAIEDMNIHLCPETGICSIVADDGRKADLMPDEVGRIREGGSEAVRAVIGEADAAFAESLTANDVARIAETLN